MQEIALITQEGGRVADSRPRPARPGGAVDRRVLRALFEFLYRDRRLYWLASTIPFAGQWRTWQRLAMPRLVGSDVLETGCGTGTLLVDMARAGYACTAIERSPQMLAAARDRIRRHGLQGRVVSLRQGSAMELPYPDRSFDSVVSTFPTEYIFDPATTREMARVLRPGGRVVVVLGAQLIPVHFLLLPLVGLQTLVYGRGQRRTRSAAGAAGAAAGDTRPGGTRGPRTDLLLERMNAAGLVARIEPVRGPFWEAILYIAEKPAAETGGSAPAAAPQPTR
jgi:SAM-dependent methyltransferase